jgi:hypothetical protein
LKGATAENVFTDDRIHQSSSSSNLCFTSRYHWKNYESATAVAVLPEDTVVNGHRNHRDDVLSGSLNAEKGISVFVILAHGNRQRNDTLRGEGMKECRRYSRVSDTEERTRRRIP